MAATKIEGGPKLRYVPETIHEGLRDTLRSSVGYFWRNVICRIGEDWVFLTILGIMMAATAFAINSGVTICNRARNWLYLEASAHQNYAFLYLAWVSPPVLLVLFAAHFCKSVSPQAAGSGIPEMKTILRGVTLNDHLTFATLLSKIVSLTATLGAGMPLGKEGPFVHIASIHSVLLGRLVAQFRGICGDAVGSTEMTAAACALGVACCFGAPIGGVLFTVEVTTSYYCVRNYWRAFYVAIWGTVLVNLTAVWSGQAPALTPFFRTNLHVELPYGPRELVYFAVMGLCCGVGGGLYILVHRNYMKLLGKRNVLAQYPFLYAGAVSLLTASATFPPGCGRYMAAQLNSAQHMTQLFSNFPWSSPNLTIEQQETVAHWSTPNTGILLHLSVLTAFTFVFSILSVTMPVACGCFVPIFKIGGAIGRIVGEVVYTRSPSGVVPGGYAIAGAAAFSGAVTQTVSTSLIAFELCGEIAHSIPTLVATIVANFVAGLFAPSMYDNVILLKKLPFLPDLLPSTSAMYSVYVEDFMVRDVKFVYCGMTFEELERALLGDEGIARFPLVNGCEMKVLLGSIHRNELLQMLVPAEKRPVKFARKRFSSTNLGATKPAETLKEPVDFSLCTVDPSPFQLVQRTSLLRVHSVFSMMGIDVAYVTDLGRLVGVVGLKELRAAIEAANAGHLKPRDLEIPIDVQENKP